MMGVPGAAHHQAQIEAIKAVASIVEVDEPTFRDILRAHEQPTIVTGESGALWFKRPVYLTTYDGFVFLLKAAKAVDFAQDAPRAFWIRAKSVTIPFL